MAIYAEIAIQHPKEFWKFFTLFSAGFSHYESSTAYNGKQYNSNTYHIVDIVSVLENFGKHMLQKDQNTTWSMFDDFAFVKIVPLLKNYPQKRSSLLHLMYSFCAKDVNSRITAIKSLQEKLEDNITFIHCLTSLIHNETEFNEALEDLYMYYCIMGVSSPSPTLRAASLSMLPVLAAHSPGSVMKLIGML